MTIDYSKIEFYIDNSMSRKGLTNVIDLNGKYIVKINEKKSESIFEVINHEATHILYWEVMRQDDDTRKWCTKSYGYFISKKDIGSAISEVMAIILGKYANDFINLRNWLLNQYYKK